MLLYTLPLYPFTGGLLINKAMKQIQFILSIIIAICAIAMLYGAIINSSPMKALSISIMSVMCALSAILVRISYKELKSDI